MKDMDMKDSRDLFPDPLDRMLAERLAPLRETAVPDEGFSRRVAAALPRRDVSLWVVLAAVLAGAGAAVAVLGWEGVADICRSFEGFFASLFQHQAPSILSLVSVAGVAAALGLVFYALLDTDDYQGVPNGIER